MMILLFDSKILQSKSLEPKNSATLNLADMPDEWRRFSLLHRRRVNILTAMITLGACGHEVIYVIRTALAQRGQMVDCGLCDFVINAAYRVAHKKSSRTSVTTTIDCCGIDNPHKAPVTLIPLGRKQHADVPLCVLANAPKMFRVFRPRHVDKTPACES
jgi:hypothetical protein